VTELSKRLRLHKNNASAARTLESARLHRAEPRHRELPPRHPCSSSAELRAAHGAPRQARPIMASWCVRRGETTYLAVLRRAAVVPVEVIEADRPVRIVSQLGEALPLHATGGRQGPPRLRAGGRAARARPPTASRASPSAPSSTARPPPAAARRYGPTATPSTWASISRTCGRRRAGARTTRAPWSASRGRGARLAPDARRIEKEVAPLVLKRDASSPAGLASTSGRPRAQG